MKFETVEDIKRNFSKQEIENADLAQRMYVTMGRPSDEISENMIKKGKILNTPITITDYRNTVKIYGKDLGCLKGKTNRTKPQHVKVDVTSEQVKSLKVILSIDLMSFTGITFFVTVARDVQFITTSYLQDR
jgi:hypothetical protein